jgi:hypothetical protein
MDKVRNGTTTQTHSLFFIFYSNILLDGLDYYYLSNQLKNPIKPNQQLNYSTVVLPNDGCVHQPQQTNSRMCPVMTEQSSLGDSKWDTSDHNSDG